MTKQEFLAMSFIYGLKCQFRESEDRYCRKKVIGTIGGVYNDGSIVCRDTVNACPSKFKLILRPLSDLTKEIEHKGVKFVPIVKLAKMSYPNHEWRLSSSGLYACVGNGYMTFEYDYGYNCFLCNNSAQLDQLKCLFKAIEWHFDLFGGIESGEAIDVNTLNINPYA